MAREDNPSVMSAVRAFLAQILIHPWDEAAAEAHARIRILAKRLGRSAGAFDTMIAALFFWRRSIGTRALSF